jgi:hypothetical protein
MFFSKEFIESVEENPVIGIVEACKNTFEEIQRLNPYEGSGWTEDEHELLWEAASFINLIIESNQFFCNAVLPDPIGNLEKNCIAVQKYLNLVFSEFQQHSIKLKIDMHKKRYQTELKSTFAYEFSQGDFDRIQKLVNELRDYIVANDNFEEDHRLRLLKRLELLQSELHKRVSDLDRFWGLVGDAGVMLGKFGNDAKPIVDRIRELAEIVWKTQARAEELPSSSKNPMIGYEEVDRG